MKVRAVDIATDHQIIEALLDREGGTLSNAVSDEGGWTKWGVTLPILSEWLGLAATVDDLRRLSREEAHRLYARLFLAPWAFVPDPTLRALLMDICVHHGRTGGTRIVQRVAAVKADGRLGPTTRRAVVARDADEFRLALLRGRGDALVGAALAEVPTWIVESTDLRFLKGWIRRLWAFVR